MAIIEKIGVYKKENNLTILQLKRWEIILSNRTFLAEKVGLSHDFIRKMLELIHDESIRIQTKVMNNEDKKRWITFVSTVFYYPILSV